MGLSENLANKYALVGKTFEKYCEDVADNQRETTNEFTGVLVETIEVKSLGRLHNLVGVNKGKLLRNQLNTKKVNYAKYYYDGHSEVMVSFDRKVPNSKQSGTDGLWWHFFHESDGSDGIHEAVKQAGSLSDKLSKVIRG